MRTASKLAAVIAIAGLTTTGLAACSSSNDADSGSKSDGPVTINYLHRLPDGKGMTPVAQTVERWNKEHPDVHVEATKFDGEAREMINRLSTDVNAGTAPCLAQIGYSEVPELFSKGMLTDVTKQAEKYKGDFSGTIGQMSVGDKTVGLPQDTGPLVYYFDKAALDELGAKAPTNTEELLTLARKAKEHGKYAIAFTPDEAGNWLTGQAAAAGDNWYQADGDKWKVNTKGEGSQKVADFWQKVLDEKLALVAPRFDNAFTQALIDHKLIGHIGAAWESGFMLDEVYQNGQQGTWNVAQLPDFSAGQKSAPDGGSGVAVMKGCKNPEQAMEFAHWFNTQTEDLASQGLIVAADKGSKTPEKIKKQFGGQDVYQEFTKANKNVPEDFGFIPGFSTVSSNMAETAAHAGDGKAKVKDIFTGAQDASVKALKDLNLKVAE